MHLCAGTTSVLERRANLDTFDGRDGRHRRRQPRVEPLLPMNVTPQPDRDACSDDDKDAAEGVARLACRVNRCPHPRGGILVGAVDVACFG